MNKLYQVRYQGKQVAASFDSENDCYVINGLSVTCEEVKHLAPFTITAQVYEWYGNEEYPVGDTAHGRYKPKGGETFIMHLTDAEAMYDDEIVNKLQAKFNAKGRYMLYDFAGQSFFPHSEPIVLSYENGVITPPYENY